mmetsp:Transcript_19235/g.64458  ORF Transcript_19235/g.64458 Transcript_19235/m.64458 type:complete len:332 (+) Transcript_19235:23-1018(+)
MPSVLALTLAAALASGTAARRGRVEDTIAPSYHQHSSAAPSVATAGPRDPAGIPHATAPQTSHPSRHVAARQATRHRGTSMHAAHAATTHAGAYGEPVDMPEACASAPPASASQHDAPTSAAPTPPVASTGKRGHAARMSSAHARGYVRNRATSTAAARSAASPATEGHSSSAAAPCAAVADHAPKAAAEGSSRPEHVSSRGYTRPATAHTAHSGSHTPSPDHDEAASGTAPLPLSAKTAVVARTAAPAGTSSYARRGMSKAPQAHRPQAARGAHPYRPASATMSQTSAMSRTGHPALGAHPAAPSAHLMLGLAVTASLASTQTFYVACGA